MNTENLNLVKMIIQSIKDLNDQSSFNTPILNPSKNTVLFGLNGSLDSLGLVNLLVYLEEKISDEFNVNLTLANERALSHKNSPFRTVSSLSQYIEVTIRENYE